MFKTAQGKLMIDSALAGGVASSPLWFTRFELWMSVTAITLGVAILLPRAILAWRDLLGLSKERRRGDK
jgi:hypothetical protein